MCKQRSGRLVLHPKIAGLIYLIFGFFGMSASLYDYSIAAFTIGTFIAVGVTGMFFIFAAICLLPDKRRHVLTNEATD